MLVNSKVLRKLELEGNILGPNSVRAFGKALKKNTTLRLLDLESNQITQDGQEFQGVYDFVKVLFVAFYPSYSVCTRTSICLV